MHRSDINFINYDYSEQTFGHCLPPCLPLLCKVIAESQRLYCLRKNRKPINLKKKENERKYNTFNIKNTSTYPGEMLDSFSILLTNRRNQRVNTVKIWGVEPIGVAQPLLSLPNMRRWKLSKLLVFSQQKSSFI